MIDALKKSYDLSVCNVGAMAIIVDPLGSDAETFYAKYDFIKLENGKKFMVMQTVARLFKGR